VSVSFAHAAGPGSGAMASAFQPLWMLVRLVAMPKLAVLDLGEGGRRLLRAHPGSLAPLFARPGSLPG